MNKKFKKSLQFTITSALKVKNKFLAEENSAS